MDVCQNVLPILELIKGKTLVAKEVVPVNGNNLGLYVNTYAPFVDGKIIEEEQVVIALNYLDYAVTYNGQTIEPLSAKVL